MAKLPLEDATPSDPNVNPRDGGVPGLAADGLAQAAGFAERGPPPLHLWHPPFCGDLPIRILRDGTWHYQGTPITRAPMVRLFASILRREGDGFFLVTPVEKVGITVEDAPFIALDCTATGEGRDQVVTFLTNVDDTVPCGEGHPLRMAEADGQPSPRLTVREGLEARPDRKTWLRLVDLCTHHDGGFGLWSGGVFFPLTPSDAL